VADFRSFISNEFHNLTWYSNLNLYFIDKSQHIMKITKIVFLTQKIEGCLRETVGTVKKLPDPHSQACQF
jgi:hypothetical protein